MNELDFIPVRGKESDILKQSPQLGFFCVATDTGKIYLDVQDDLTGELVHKPVGGSGATILYATATLTELPNGEVWFTKDQLENPDASVNLGDLIINKDGKFLKVTELSDETITCSIIAVSGTGGGGGGEGPAANGSAKIEYIGSSSMTVLKGSPCVINFRLIAVDAAGDPVNVQGTATWAIGSVWLKDNTQRVKPGDNFFDIGPYLSLGTDQTVTVKVEINTGGEVNSTARKNWNVSVVDLSATWDYNMRTINDAKKDTTITWTSFGAINKVAKILVDGVHSYEKEIGKGSNISTDFTIPGEVLTHGYHTVSLHLEADLNGETIPSNTITHEMIFVDKEDPAAPPVIVLGEVPSTMQQYNTLFIPVVVYDHSKVGSTVDVTYYESDIPLSSRAVDNGSQFSWNYTPSDYGYRKLTIESGVSKRNIDLEVEKIDLGSTAEVGGYAFKLKASDFSGNEDLQKWKIGNELGLEFSEGFDWVNGGLKSELDAAGNTRSYINVRAGNRMTIKYEPFRQNVTDTIGKCFKFIFKVTQCRDYDAEAIRCYYATESGDSERGIKIGAQRALFKSSGSNVTVPYCEDTYIELEFDVTNRSSSNKGYYITTWVDGVPSGIVEYSDDAFDFKGFIEVGSDDADVQVYLIKTYEKHLTDTEHLSNFIMDAPNAAEMMARFVRNDILDERGEIDYRLLAQKNPDCRVHCYRIPRMTLNKDDKVKNCDYMQFHGSDQAVVTASGVTTRVQGTSSAGYGIAAFNLDAKFENGFDYPDGSHTDGWAMDENAIPVNYLTTKVNVASCENANNALNQEWYNRYQPYRSPNREKNPKARDCMQFYPGVLFILDENQETSYTDAANGVKNNVFCDTEGYVQNPYYKLYAVCNMGNSKKNTEVFHDESNPLECCIEVADNQNDVQKMIKCQGLDVFGKKNVFVDLERLFDEDGNDIDITYSYTDEETGETETRTKTAYALWRAANMSKAAFEFRYPDEFGDNGEDCFEQKYPEYARTALIGWFNFVKWLADNNPAAATNEPLPAPVKFDNYTFRGDKYSSKIGTLTVSAFAGTYETDSEKYRMAKMLSECEDHFVMDSVMFHYLFIERHTMIDNVAKNTFWSSADATHWDLTKNYDNDTADGNDNQGKLTLTYGLEPGDTINEISVFNGPGSVWLEFARRLTDVAATLFRALESTEYGSAWNSKTYLKAFEDWQAAIPERCWIEAYRRLYIRPNEVYKENAYLSMLEGGKKTGQRRQYETYQDMYISSKYFGNDCQTAKLNFRPNASNLKQYELPMKMYSDCYVLAGLGQNIGVGSINYSRRTKRGEVFNFISPVDNLVDATGYLYPANYYQEIGKEEKSLNIYNPDQLAFNGATKLNKLVMGYYEGENTKINNDLIEVAFGGNTLLEELYAVGFMAATKSLNLTSCLNLCILDARKSSFTQILLPDSAPITQVLLEEPRGLVMSNLNKITEFEAKTLSKLETLRIDNIDKCPGINSLEILKARYDDGATDALFAYNMQNVEWVESNSARISNAKVDYLEFLRSKKPIDSAGNEISTKAALTGKLVITGGAYNTNNSDTIYDEYCNSNDNGFGNLDIEFVGADAKMPKITILNQSGEPVWSRRIKHTNTGFDANFFKAGPMGAFQVFTSSNTLDKTYTFENKYKIGGAEYDADADGYPVYTNSVTEDLVIEPVFTSVTRQYEVTIKNFDGTELLKEAADYGTPLATLARKISTPQNYVYTSEYGYEDISNNIYLCWKFEGYKIGSNSVVTTIENLEKITVSSDVTLTAAFKKAHVYDNPLQNAAGAKTILSIDNKGILNTVQHEDKTIFKGRITIPNTLNGIEVRGLGTGFLQQGFKVESNGVTAIFFQPKKYTVNDNLEATVQEYQSNISFAQYAFSTSSATTIEMPLFNEPTMASAGAENVAFIDGYAKNIIFVPETTVIPNNLLNRSGSSNIITNIETIMGDITHIGSKAFNQCGNIFSNLPSSSLVLPSIVSIGTQAMYGCNGKTLQTYFGGSSTAITFNGPIINSTWDTVTFDDKVMTLNRTDGSTDPILSANNISCPAAISDFVTNNMIGSVSTTA